VDILADVFRQHGIAHAPLRLAGIEIFLFEIETIFAIQIADRPDRFREDMKRSSGVDVGWLAQAGSKYQVAAGVANFLASHSAERSIRSIGDVSFHILQTGDTPLLAIVGGAARVFP